MTEKKRKGNSVKGKRLDKMKKTERTPSKSEKAAEPKKNASVTKTDNASSARYILVMILLSILAVFISICFIVPNNVGLLGYGLAMGFFGTFGIAAFLVPVLMLLVICFWKRDVASGAVRYRYLVAIGVLVMFGVIIHTFRGMALHEEYTFESAFVWDSLGQLFVDGMEYQGGGFIGGIFALLLICSFGYPGTLIFGFLLLIALLMLLFGLTPAECAVKLAALRQRMIEKRKVRQEKKAIALAMKKEEEKKRAAAAPKKAKKADVD